VVVSSCSARGGGADAPDIALASREIKATELQQCIDNGVGEVEEIGFGYDGIVFAMSEEERQANIEKVRALKKGR
jgi:phosphate transport system substrate-binding protein